MSGQLTQLRYSLNGISEGQIRVLFDKISNLSQQVVLRRISSPRIALSLDDIILEGEFPISLVESLSRAFPPPLSFKVEYNSPIKERLQSHSSFEWQENPTLFCGVTLLPFISVQQQLEFDNAWQFLRLINTTEAASILKPFLAIKPKGMIAVKGKMVHVVLPMHRADFLSQWLGKVVTGEADLNWLSGSTGELSDELRKVVSSVSPEKLPTLQTWIQRTPTDTDVDFERLFNRVLSVISS